MRLRAWPRLINAHLLHLWSLPFVIGSIAFEIAVKEAMVRAWSQASRFNPNRASFTTWLYRIVVNLCIDQRGRVRPEAIPDDFERADPAAAADEMKSRNVTLPLGRLSRACPYASGRR